MVEVLKAGWYDTIQDFGRVGVQDFGVPLSGVMDRYSARLANTVLGNSSDAAVLESVMMGPHLKFNTRTLICVSGAEMSITVNSKPIKANALHNVEAGDVLKFGKCTLGCYSYLAVLGGFQTELQMGSRSMYKGITENYKLHKGDELPILNVFEPQLEPNALKTRGFSAIKKDANLFENKELKVFKGPEFENLTQSQQEELRHTVFTISKDSNRMAYQCQEMLPNALQGILTSLVLPGTVQLTPSGKLIILMRDCQITGGYPRVLQLLDSVVSQLSQNRVGSKIQFKWLEEKAIT